MLCNLCPNKCNIDRSIFRGRCGASDSVKVARAALHMWEEPILVGKNGSGTVFFSCCTLRCVFCQNHDISHGCYGKEISCESLAEIFYSLQSQGAENINLVSPTPYVPSIKKALAILGDKLHIPIVYNCGGYESVQTVDMISDRVSVYIPDFKYYSNELGSKYSSVSNYREHATAAISRMLYHRPQAKIRDGVMKEGVIIRHLVLPSHKDDSIQLLHHMADTFGTSGYYISLMRQYTPMHLASNYPEIDRKLTSYEYNCVAKEAEKLGFDGFLQEKSSANEAYTPKFDLTGILSGQL